MKKILLIAMIILVKDVANAQSYAWTQMADFPGGDRYEAFSFAVNGKGYVGSGISYPGTMVYHNDNWEYDPAANVWVPKSNFPGTGRRGSAFFSSGNKGYMGTGWTSAQFNDWWEYYPLTDTWTQKANFMGSPRYTAAAFELDGFGYVGMGYSPLKKDFYKYDIANNVWNQITDIGGLVRQAAKGFSLNGKGYVVGGGQQGNYYTNQLWEYNPATNVWTQKSNYPGNGRDALIVVVVNGKALVGGGEDGNPNIYQDFYAYDATMNTWTQIPDFGGGPRMQAYYFSIGGCGYAGGGASHNWVGSGPNLKHDLWSVCETTGIESTSLNDAEVKVYYVNEDKIEFDFSKPVQKELDLSLYSVTGQILAKYVINPGIKNFPIEITNFSKGIYLYNLSHQNTIIKTGKISIR
jgi:N-acetylneuraminic acid mutarotase